MKLLNRHSLQRDACPESAGQVFTSMRPLDAAERLALYRARRLNLEGVERDIEAFFTQSPNEPCSKRP